MSFESVLITGANRGIGLEFVKQLLSAKTSPKYLIATTRQSAHEELDKLKANNESLHVLRFDSKDFKQYEQFVRQVEQIVGEHGIDTLINNAGIHTLKVLSDVTPEDMTESFAVNSVAPLMLTKALLPLLKKSSIKRKTVVNISAHPGSNERKDNFDVYPFRTSKAALNMISKCLAIDLKPVDINVIVMNPGWIQTDVDEIKKMPNRISAEKSVFHMLDTIKNINDSVLGKILNYDGSVIQY